MHGKVPKKKASRASPASTCSFHRINADVASKIKTIERSYGIMGLCKCHAQLHAAAYSL